MENFALVLYLMEPLLDIKPILNGPAKRIVITMHERPDADAMGSSLALANYLKQKGHEVQVISPTVFPDFLKWMPGCDEVVVFETHQKESLDFLNKEDILFCLDFNALDRTKDMVNHLKEAPGIKILIDHHLEPKYNFDYGESDITAASTTLMIYELIVAMGDATLINPDIAKCIYAGTMTDTGSFRFPATSSRVHRMVADLMDRGLDHEAIHRAIYDNYLENRLRFMGYVLVNRLEVFYSYNTAIIAVPYSDIKKYNLKAGDTEGLVNFPLSIKGIKLAALIIDRKSEIRMSFRSKGEFDVNLFAKKYFEGGGHVNAAGGSSKDSLEKTVERFKKALEENKELLGK